MNYYLRFTGVLVIIMGVAMAAGKMLAFDSIVTFLVRALSPDQVITSDGEAMLVRYWYVINVAVLFLGGLFYACSVDAVRGALGQWVRCDTLAEYNPALPRPVPVLLWSSLCGLVVVTLYLVHAHLGIKMPLLFKKEGLLENLTFVLYLLSAVACAIAARRIRRNSSVDFHRWLALFYSVCAVLFFVIAGEEVSWGQRVLGIKTPDALISLNHQHETNLHNILSRNALNDMAKWAALIFLCGLILMWAVNGVLRMPVLYFVIPSQSLVGLALITGVSGLLRNLEIFEVLLSMFITFYSYRVFMASGYRYGRYTVKNLAFDERQL